jgi:hypothetical protein
VLKNSVDFYTMNDCSGKMQDSCGSKGLGGTPAGAKRRGGSPTPREKQVSCNGNQYLRLIEPYIKKLKYFISFMKRD